MDWLARSYYNRAVGIVADAYESTWLEGDEIFLSNREHDILRAVLAKCHASIALVCRTKQRPDLILGYRTEITIV
jgi:hypothetical protein